MKLQHIALCIGMLVVAADAVGQDKDATQRARKHVGAAFKLEMAKRFDEAIIEYSKAIKADEFSYDAYFGRSALYASKKKDYNKSVADPTKLLKI